MFNTHKHTYNKTQTCMHAAHAQPCNAACGNAPGVLQPVQQAQRLVNGGPVVVVLAVGGAEVVAEVAACRRLR